MNKAWIVGSICILFLAALFLLPHLTKEKSNDAKNISNMSIPENILSVAQRHLEGKQDSEDLELLLEESRKYEFGWVFFYAPTKFIETGNSEYMTPGIAPFVVNSDGTTVDLDSSLPPDQAISNYKSQWELAS